ncbi:ABC-2 type transport system permease protein [Massilia sp. UYP32]|uniref:ABC transporter permease n=1 Tax=Massilia sp. UYP32 TaxID=1756386 RepID=UPI000D8B26E7
MKTLTFELRQVAHSRLAVGAVVLLGLLCALSVWTGLQAVSQQRAALERIAASHAQDHAAIAARQLKGGVAEAGSVGYYLPHLTLNPPSPLAFAAIGQRDLQPQALRVRLLGLHSQLYESEAINPELAMPGRFDFAFVLVFLAPLFVIALMHDLVSSEREAGRLRLLASLPAAADTWRRRVGLRYGLVWLATLLPLACGALVAGAAVADFAAIALVATLYLAFWFGLASWVAARARTSSSSAAILLACLVGLTMILPTLADAAIARLSPVSKGVELALAQRQAVHSGWDIPKPETFEKFFRAHPEWKDTPPVEGRFHWTWYYAMHQAGDDAVAADVAEYRASMQARESWTARVGLVLASVNVQVLLHRLADTDLAAQLAYQDRIAAYHTQLRRFFYPYLFEERAMTEDDLAQLPRYEHVAAPGRLPTGQLLALGALALALVSIGLRKLRI